jgi:hypothetical protein
MCGPWPKKYLKLISRKTVTVKKTANFQQFLKVDLVQIIVVKVTHFNNQIFSGFVSFEDAKHHILQSTGIKLLRHHSTKIR